MIPYGDPRLLLVFVTFVLALAACTDSPARPRLRSATAPMDWNPDLQACPAFGVSPSPFPPDLPVSPTVSAGAVAGSFSVSRTGEAVYAMPLAVPPGRAGMEPKLAVAYDSAAGEGLLGMGFGIAGLSEITRCPRNVAQDGAIRAVRDDAGDALCLDGKRLVPTAVPIDSPSAQPREYRTFPDTFAKIVADFAEPEGWEEDRGPKRLTVLTKSGLVVEYGGSAEGRVLAQKGVVRSWLVTRMSDRNGNTIQFTYRNEIHPTGGYTVEHAPSRIDYTGHPLAPASRAVVFEYTTLEGPEQRSLFARGMELRRSLRLDRIAMLGPGDALVREYRFSYGSGPATGRLLLQQVEECAADHVCKPPTRFTWRQGGSPQFLVLPTSIMMPQSDRSSLVLMDATGDGLDDLVIPEVDMTGGAENPATSWTFVPNFSEELTSAYFNSPSLVYQQQHPNAQHPIQPELGTPIDYNHDGRMDVFVHDVHGQYPTWRVLLATADQGLTPLDTGIQRPFTGTTPPPHLADHDASAHLADVDGDGVSDLIQCAYDGVEFHWALHRWKPEGPGFEASASPIADLVAYACNTELYTLDADSDGKVDLVVPDLFETAGGPVPGGDYVALTFVHPSAPWIRTETDLPPVQPTGRMIFLDVNGDGLSDAVQTGFGDRQLRTFMNTGAGFSAAQDSLDAPVLDADVFVRLAVPIDFNMDGRQDLLLPMPNPGSTPSWVVLQSTGKTGAGTFAIVDPFLPFEAQVLDEQTTLAKPQGPRVTDVDGNGAQDVLLGIGGYLYVYKNALGDEDLLAGVTDGMNALDPTDPGHLPTVQITYAHLVDRAITTQGFGVAPPAETRTYLSRDEVASETDCVYPIRCAVGPRRVVSGYVLDNGANQPRHFAVAYRNGRYHRLGRGFLGFAARIVRDLDTWSGTAEFYDNVTFDPWLRAFPYAGQMIRAWRWNPTLPADPMSPEPGSGPIELSYTQILQQTIETLGGTTYFTLPVIRNERREQGFFGPGLGKTVEEYVADVEVSPATVLGETTTVVQDYDGYGNVLAESTSTDGVDLGFTVTREVSNDVDAWLLGRWTAQTECSSAGALEQCRSTTRTYDDAGQVQTETASAAGDEPETFLTLTFYRDTYGNITHTLAEDAFGQKRSACTSYDAEKIFPYARINPAGHLTLSRFDAGLGVQMAAADANGLVTRWGHDGFGRVTKEARPDGTFTTYTRTRTKDGGPFGDAWNVKLETSTPGLGGDTVEYDSLGRAVRWWTQGVAVGGAPAERVVQEIAFDHRGEHVARRSVPAGETTPPSQIHWETFEQDGMGRVVKHVAPWGAVTTYEYLGAMVVKKAPDGGRTRTQNDALGRPVEITDAEDGVTTFTYGPFGGLWTVTDPGGAVTTTERDAYGRVRQHVDPNRGATEAHYNGFGQRTASLDAAGRAIALFYDPLGRQVVRVDDDGTTTWTWDAAANGIGRIAQVESPDGHLVEYGYDAFGRLETTELTLDGETLGSSVSYDAYGRVETVTYPQGDGVAPFVIARGYDAHGHLLSVANAATGQAYWEILAADDAGRITSETFGNGATTTRNYYETRDRVASIVTTLGATTVQDLLYVYDEKLNPERRADGVRGKTEYFEHDLLDRLTCADFDPAPGCPEPYAYAPNGNLTGKPGIGLLTYDPARPHAVQTAGAETYGYDAVGNQDARAGAAIEYTAFDLPKLITLAQGGGDVTFDYDGDQTRIRKTTAEEVTVYFGDLYERVTRVGAELEVEHRYSVHSNGRAVAVVRQAAGAASEAAYVHADALGSVDALTDGAGNVEWRSYDAFGELRDISGGTPATGPLASMVPWGFTGHARDDDLGLVNMKGRMYDPKLGRFLTPDPIVARPHFGQSWNAYSYVMNSPLSYVDPTGFSAEEAPPADAPEGTYIVVYTDGTYSFMEVLDVTDAGPDAEDETDPPEAAAEAGAVVPPADVAVWGNTAGFVPQAGPAAPEGRGNLGTAGEIGVGAAEGLGGLGTNVAKSLVLNALTFGGYGTYEFGKSVWNGFWEDGALGALNAVNPLYTIAKGGADTYLAVEDGNYRAAAAHGVTTAVLGVATALGMAQGVGALAGRTAAAGGGAAARGGVTSSRALKAADLGLEGTDAIVQGTIRIKDSRALVKFDYLGSESGLGRAGMKVWSRLKGSARAEGATRIRVETSPIIEATGRLQHILSKLGFQGRSNGTMFYEGEL